MPGGAQVTKRYTPVQEPPYSSNLVFPSEEDMGGWINLVPFQRREKSSKRTNTSHWTRNMEAKQVLNFFFFKWKLIMTYSALVPVLFFFSERHWFVVLHSYTFIGWFLYVPRQKDQTHNLGITGRHSHQVSYPARALFSTLKIPVGPMLGNRIRIFQSPTMLFNIYFLYYI